MKKTTTIDYGPEWLNNVGATIGSAAHVEIFRISPDDARAILDRSQGHNFRKPSQAHVDRLCNLMKTGNWFDNGEPLQFNVDGVLINGQHRLLGLIAAGTSLDFSIRFNADERGIDKIRSRTPGQHMAHHGAQNGRGVVSVLRLVLAHESQRKRKVWSENINVEDFQIADLYDEDPELAEISAKYCAHRRNAVIPEAIAGWLFYETSRAGCGEKCVQFLERATDGVNLSRSDAIYWLRERIQGAKARRTKLTRTACISLVIAAWNKFFLGEECRCLRVEDGMIPKLQLKK